MDIQYFFSALLGCWSPSGEVNCHLPSPQSVCNTCQYWVVNVQKFHDICGPWSLLDIQQLSSIISILQYTNYMNICIHL